jgi:hypothetical protein
MSADQNNVPENPATRMRGVVLPSGRQVQAGRNGVRPKDLEMKQEQSTPPPPKKKES